MTESKISTPADTLIAVLKSSLSASGAHAFGYLVLYTTFGVVRGRTGLAFHLGLESTENDGAEPSSPLEVLELNDVTVEHYSNHLASANFERLYVRLSDVHGFALVGNQGQG